MDPLQVFKKSQSNFAIAFWGLDAEAKKAMTAIYAFCRLVDDIVDESQDMAWSMRELSKWRRFVNDFSNADDPLKQALVWSHDTFGLDRKHFHALIDGMVRDTDHQGFDNWEQLMSYCDQVASSVGHLCLTVLGVSEGGVSFDYGQATGRALQLTNIIRDMTVDARINRIYVPREVYQLAGLTQGDMLAPVWNARMKDVLERLIEQAQGYYDMSEKAALGLNPQHLWPCEVMKKVYKHIFLQVKRDPQSVFEKKIIVPAWKKFMISRREFIKAKCL